MSNIDRVTSFIRDKYPDQTTLHFHHTSDRLNYCVLEKGTFWRVSNYVDSVTYDITDDLSIIEHAGKAFGRFQHQLADFDGSSLYETIPDFHNTEKRLNKLFEDAKKDEYGKVEQVKPELEYINSVKDEACDLSIRFNKGEFPARVTHNDTKTNNVLFDPKTKEPIIVIDLDTVMPGMSLYDFADGVRFIASAAKEDEPDLNSVYFNTEKFKAFTEGYIPQVKSFLSRQETEALAKSVFSITIELASRFLDDYITGNKYFKCTYEKHNLVRARNQIKLAQDIFSKKDELENIVRVVALEH